MRLDTRKQSVLWWISDCKHPWTPSAAIPIFLNGFGFGGSNVLRLQT